MTKEKYIEQEISKLTWSSLIAFFPYGSLFIMLLCILDYLVTPENFLRFFTYRLIAASVGITSFIIIKLKKEKTKYFQLFFIFVGVLFPSIMVESMILSFGGHQSTYYAGMIVVIIFVLGFIPISVKLTAIIVSLIYAIYLLPILLLDNITNTKLFFNNNMFLMGSALGALGWRYFYQRLIIRNLSLEYNLAKDKEQLEMYSNKLEDMVALKTEELSISEKWYKSTFDNATDGIIVMDKNRKITNVNQKACELHGFEKDKLIGVNIGLLEANKDTKKFEERMSRILNGESLSFETEHFKKEGDKVLLEVSSKRIDIGDEILIQSFYRDITEKKRIQEQLMHSQKMESVGQLAGGIAHNFNNLLTAILGYTEMLVEYSNLDNESRQKVKNIEGSARKAGVMVSKLLSFARRETHEIHPLNLHDIINESIKLLEGVLDKRIGIKTELNKNISVIEGDPNQLEQVIMNLVVNARDAMPDGGLITIKTGIEEVKRGTIDIPTYIVPGKYVVLTISDTGNGIPKDIINRIFDPFFTTKERGKGTGLGLAMVYGTIKDHKGYISVQSEVGKGTTFDIYFPVSDKPVYVTARPQLFSVEGHENILVVDDEEDVLFFIKDILEKHGYKVLPANNSLSAIDTFRSFTRDIHLVITDIIMPLMEGIELIKNLRKIKPDIKIIVVSGYSDEPITKENMMIDAFIKKPFEGSYLLSIVRRILDAGIRRSPFF